MLGINEVSTFFNEIKELVIEVTALIAIILFCILYVLHHLKDFKQNK